MINFLRLEFQHFRFKFSNFFFSRRETEADILLLVIEKALSVSDVADVDAAAVIVAVAVDGIMIELFVDHILIFKEGLEYL